MGPQPISYSNPYSSEEMEIARRRKLAEALQAQGMSPLGPTEQIGGWAIKRSPLEGAAKAAQQISGAYQSKRADEKQKALAERYSSDLARTLATAGEAATGTPAIQAPSDELGGGPGRPATAPNKQALIQALMGHPATQPIAMQQLQSDLSQQQLAATLAGAGYGPQTGGAGVPVPGGAAPGGAPAGPRGIPPGVDPLAWALMVQKGDTAGLAKLVQDAANEQNKPVVNRGFGIGRMVNGQYVPDQASLEQALGMERGRQGIQAPMEPPVTLKMSNGQEVQLSRPEWAEFQKNGQLPQRLGGPAPVQRSTAPTEAAALEQVKAARGAPTTVSVDPVAPAAAKAGVVGLSQSDEDKTRQERERTAGKAVDEAFAKDYVAFSTGGAQDAVKQLSQLEDVVKALNAPGAKLTGPLIGGMPDAALKFSGTGRNAIAMRERVEEVVQRSLRAVLGTQFTEKEGERLIARAYNPNLSESENSIRVGRLMQQLKQAHTAKQDAAAYFEKHNTLQGWKGKLPSMSDFDPVKQDAEAKVGKPQISDATREFLKQQGISLD